MTSTTLSKTHITDMGYSVRMVEQADGYVIWRGGRPISKRDGETMVYRGLTKALGRFNREVSDVEAMEAKLKQAGVWHPIHYCACGCGTELRRTDRRYPDGRVDTVQDQIDRDERSWLVGHRPQDVNPA